MRVLSVHNAVSVRLILVSIAYFTYLHATVLQTAIVWIGISRHWKQNDLSAHTYVFARWLFPLGRHLLGALMWCLTETRVRLYGRVCQGREIGVAPALSKVCDPQ